METEQKLGKVANNKRLNGKTLEDNNFSSHSSHHMATPIHNTTDTSECSPPSLIFIKEFLKSKNNDLKKLNDEELISILDKLFTKGKFRNCIKLCK